MFAPIYHPAMRHVGPTRREVGVRTVFNILGPLTNPAAAQYQCLGVADVTLAPLMAQALLRLGCARALVIHGLDGVDEFSLSGPTLVAEVRGERGDVVEYQVTPQSVGLAERAREEIRGGDAAHNAALLRRVLSGEQTGAAADIVAFNAGAALYITDRAQTISEGVRQAQDALRVGRAIATLDALIATSQRLAATVA
jgi:anthranilate phosphoribosyltransferase